MPTKHMAARGGVGTRDDAAGAVYLFSYEKSNFFSCQNAICGGLTT